MAYRFAVAGPGGQLSFWIDTTEPCNCFVTLFATDRASHFQQFPGGVRREQAPSFVSGHQRIPRTRPQRIYMNARARSCRSHNKPTVWWTTLLARILEQIVLKILWYGVVF